MLGKAQQKDSTVKLKVHNKGFFKGVSSSTISVPKYYLIIITRSLPRFSSLEVLKLF